VFACTVASCLPARAEATVPSFWFVGTRLILERPQMKDGDIAVGSDDAGLAHFLDKLGATLAYAPGQKYAVVTSGDHRTISFTLGETRFTVAGTTETAPFAPYAAGGVVYVPFVTLAKALYVTPLDDGGGVTVLQPQVGGLDVKTVGRVTIALFHAAGPLHFRRLSGPGDEKLEISFPGVASTLDPERATGSGALRHVSIGLEGSTRNPTTIIDFEAAPGSVRALAPTDSANVVAFAFGSPGVVLGGTPVPAAGDATVAAAPLSGVPPPPRPPSASSALPPPPRVAAAPASPSPPPRESPTPPLATPSGGPAASAAPTAAGPAQITSLATTPVGEGLDVQVGVTGDVDYEWHRLPDNRWYVDFKDAQLVMAPVDESADSPAVRALRVKQITSGDEPVVRVALTLPSPRTVKLLTASNGVTIHVDSLDDLVPQKVGAGTIAGGAVVASDVAPTPAADQVPAGPGDTTWKYAAPPVQARNPRLIVLDPGHGGSDSGAMHNGLVEKELTLDVSERLKALLLARGWQVKLTRESDTDVFAANDSAHDELQARCDVANNQGARLFISVHINSFTSSGLNGTTTYYYKAEDYPLAQAIHERFAATLPTNDDGVQKANFYVIHHTTMPAILVETAFLSNAHDAALLRSPAFLQKVALGIADGVGAYASKVPPALSSTSNDTDNGY
jgi:N-acetylmuramoyl-L-alanine amidase CwlD